ncbi:MAG: bifunctional phosphoribosyl-AMP cyclohydrolase/phosphoribosyl-ATP diphosphatase HisIE [Lachnospiraceae bacterium]|nr:bifunctional phosphoribosyl-AMP cyclohydrolase/phosphoribosyl-ATP diphosphatase HisIE [Lachnospiraceae bacterium]
MGELKKTEVGSIVLREISDVLSDEQIKEAVADAYGMIRDGVSMILAFDRGASDDAAHQRAMDLLCAVCKAVDVPVIGTGEIGRMEDVKKLLYAGCDRVALPVSAYEDKALFDEVFGKFGADRLAVLTDPDHAGAMEDARSAADTEKVFPLPVIAPVSDEDSRRVPYLVSADLLPKPLTAAISWDALKKGPDGLVPVVAQDYRTDEVLMVAYMDEAAYRHTIETGRMTYYSRSRKEQWVKGETSGHYQYVRSLTADCDLDTILAKVKQVGAACHTGARSCFFNGIAKHEENYKNPQQVLQDVYAVIADRKVNPKEGSYTNYLFDKGIDKILKKCGEEATEIVIAAKNPNDNEIVYEISDFLYHVMVLMVEKGVTWEEVTEELARR